MGDSDELWIWGIAVSSLLLLTSLTIAFGWERPDLVEFVYRFATLSVVCLGAVVGLRRLHQSDTHHDSSLAAQKIFNTQNIQNQIESLHRTMSQNRDLLDLQEDVAEARSILSSWRLVASEDVLQVQRMRCEALLGADVIWLLKFRVAMGFGVPKDEPMQLMSKELVSFVSHRSKRSLQMRGALIMTRMLGQLEDDRLIQLTSRLRKNSFMCTGRRVRCDGDVQRMEWGKDQATAYLFLMRQPEVLVITSEAIAGFDGIPI